MSSSECYCATCGASNQAGEDICFACGSSLSIIDKHLAEEASTAHILKQRYRLLAQVGAGGFSAVYKAQDITNGENVAVKAVSLRGLTTQEKIEATDAFNREIGLLSTLKQRNLSHIRDHFTDTECWYLVMDYIDGISLEKYLENKGAALLPLEEVLDIALLLCDVLEYLHTRQPAIIFRDLKPSNIMLSRDGHLYLIDFGIARRYKPGQAHDTIPFGSPGYAAPEQYGKAQTTPRADIYSLGVILHQCLSGNDPSQTPFAFDALQKQKQLVPEQLAILVAEMIALNSAQRPERIQLVRQQLEQISKQQLKQRSSYWGVRAQHAQPAAPTRGNRAFYQPAPAPSFSGSSAGAGGQSMAAQSMAAPISYAQPFVQFYLRNNYAIISIVSSLVGIFLAPSLCFINATTGLMYMFHTSTTAWLFGLIVLAPCLLAIICGHIGRAQASSVPGMQGSADTATTGMTIGYVFGILYLIFGLCMLSSINLP